MFSRQGTPSMITSIVGSMPLSPSAAVTAWILGYGQTSSALAGDGRLGVADSVTAGLLTLGLAEVGYYEGFGRRGIVAGHVEPRGIGPGQTPWW